MIKLRRQIFLKFLPFPDNLSLSSSRCQFSSSFSYCSRTRMNETDCNNLVFFFFARSRLDFGQAGYTAVGLPGLAPARSRISSHRRSLPLVQLGEFVVLPYDDDDDDVVVSSIWHLHVVALPDHHFATAVDSWLSHCRDAAAEFAVTADDDASAATKCRSCSCEPGGSDDRMVASHRGLPQRRSIAR